MADEGSGEGKRQMGVNRAEERFTHTVIVGRFRAILFQALCLALTFVCLDGANGQTNPIVNSAEDNPVRSETDQLFEKANELYLKKDYDAALPLLDRCLLLKENALGRDDPQVADVLLLIGDVYREKGDSARALPYLQRSLGIKERVFGKDSTAVGLVLYRIGFLYCKRGDFERALPYIERSLKLVSPLPDNAENLETKADLYWGLGLSYSARFELDRAIQAFNESLKLKEKLVGADDSSLVELLIEIAELHSVQGRPTDAIPLLERALAISEKKFGTESAEAATALASLGNTRAQAGQFEPALASLKRSLQIREKMSPPTSPDLGTATSNLGTIYAQDW